MATKLLREARRLIRETGLPITEQTDSDHRCFVFEGRRVFTLTNGSGGRDLNKLRSALARARSSMERRP